MFSAALLAVVAGLLTALSAKAETPVADFYRNKSVDIYIGFSVGGSMTSTRDCWRASWAGTFREIRPLFRAR